MPKQKYYYAVVDADTGLPHLKKYTGAFLLSTRKPDAMYEASRLINQVVVTIPADSLHKLILSHANKKAK